MKNRKTEAGESSAIHNEENLS